MSGLHSRAEPGGRLAGLPVTVVAWTAMAGIFVLDLRLGAGYAVPLLYVPVIVLGLKAASSRLVPVLAAGATALTALDVLNHPEPVSDVALFNRSLAAVAVWITAGGVLLYRREDRRRRESVRALEDLKLALDQAAIVATTDVQGRITYVNDTFCEISKYSRAELLGQDHRTVNSRFHEPAFMRDLWRTIAAGRVWRAEIRNRAKDGSIYWVDTTIVPFLNVRGKPWQYMAIRYDITDKKAQEARLRDQASLAALGEFAAVVAHEVRNPLGGLRNGVQVIASELPDDSDGAQLARDIVARVDTLNVVIEDLLTFARPRPIRPTAVPMTRFLSDVIRAFRQDPEMAAIDVDLAGDAGVTVQADADQLRLVFMNLLVNAAQAMGGRGRIAVRVGAGSDVCAVSVADEGPGIPDALRERVFEPFFTTRRRGSGLGLPTVKRVVEAHHGRVTLESPPDGGTEVRLVLPRAQPHAADPADVSAGHASG